MSVEIEMKRAKKSAEAHWEYIKAVLRTTVMEEDYILDIGFHYKTAFIHGWKHAKEDGK